MLDELMRIADGNTRVQLTKRTYHDEWECEISITTDGTVLDITVQDDDANVAVQKALDKYNRAIKQLPELRPALTYQPPAQPLNDEIPF